MLTEYILSVNVNKHIHQHYLSKNPNFPKHIVKINEEKTTAKSHILVIVFSIET